MEIKTRSEFGTKRKKEMNLKENGKFPYMLPYRNLNRFCHLRRVHS